MSGKTIQDKILEAMHVDEFEKANEPMQEEITDRIKSDLEKLITKPSTTETIKEYKAFKTDTFIDGMFLDSNEQPIDGLPFCSNTILTGLPNSGKSLFINEMVLRIANSGHKICFVTSEEVFNANNARMDLENRMKEKAKVLGLDWKIINKNLFVLDVVKNAELRRWHIFAKAYRFLVEKEGTVFLAVDSITLLEDSRGHLKYRLLEIIKHGQNNGITTILINQRSVEETDSFNMSGGLSLSHIADIVLELDFKKISSWDAQMKLDMNVKQGEVVNFFRILKCRMGKHKANYFKYEITKDGLVKLT